MDLLGMNTSVLCATVATGSTKMSRILIFITTVVCICLAHPREVGTNYNTKISNTIFYSGQTNSIRSEKTIYTKVYVQHSRGFHVAKFGQPLSYDEFRKLDCVTEDKSVRGGPQKSRCHLVIKDLEDEEPGRNAPEGDGCFSEVHNGEDRIYCDLVCPKAHAVFHSKSLNHRACFKFHTYGLEQRGEDWFLWRSGKCLNSTALFDIGCKFDAPFKTQFASDKDVFARLKARKV